VGGGCNPNTATIVGVDSSAPLSSQIHGCNPNAATIVGVDMWEGVVTPNYPNISLIFMKPRLQETARILKFLLSFLLTGVSI